MNIPKDIINAINRNQSFVITGHISPDGDCLGSSVALSMALSNIGKEVFIPSLGSFKGKYSFLAQYGEKFSKLTKKADIAIVLDCSTPDRVDWGIFGTQPSIPLIIIDHHKGNMMFGEINWVEVDKPAVAQMIYYLLNEMSIQINEKIASALYVAILTDTGKFSFPNTTPEIFRVAADLVELGASPKILTEKLYYCNSESFLKNIGIALTSLRSYLNGEVIFMTIKNKDVLQYSTSITESEGIIDFAMSLKNVKVAVLLKEIDSNNVKASLRSRDDIDTSSIARIFGGGGHKNAAGCSIYGNLDYAEDVLLSAITNILQRKGTVNEEVTI